MLKYAFFHNAPKTLFFTFFIAFLLAKFLGQKNFCLKKNCAYQKIFGPKYIFVAEGGKFFNFLLKMHKNHIKYVNFSLIFRIC